MIAFVMPFRSFAAFGTYLQQLARLYLQSRTAKDSTTMLVLLFYFIANLALFTVMERAKRRTVVICHGVLFLSTFTLLLFCSDVPVVRSTLVDFFGRMQYQAIVDSICIPGLPAMLPFAVTELIVLLQMFVIAAYIAAKVVEVIRGTRHKKYQFLDNRKQDDVFVPIVVERKKLYYILSTLLC